MNFADDPLQELPLEVRTYIRALEAKASCHEQRLVGYEQQVVGYENKIGILQQHIERLEEQFRLAQLKRFAPSSEKFGAQGCLFNEAEVAVEAQPAVADDVVDADDTDATNDEAEVDASVPKTKRGRKPLPAHLRRVRIEHDLADVDKVCACCDGALHRMGEEVSEQLHIVPAKVEVLQHVRFKYACRQCEQHGIASNIITSAMPAQPIPRSIASASTVAAVMTAKYADGIPLYQLETVLERSDVRIGRATTGHWMVKGSAVLERLYEAMRGTLIGQAVLHGDETTVQVLKEAGRSAQSTSYMWVYRSAEGSAQPVVLFDYQPGRGHEHPTRFLDGFGGTLITDGYAAWRMLKGVTHLGCMAHVRRKFYDAFKAQKKAAGRATQALDMIGQLYQIEKKARKKPPDGLSAAEYAAQLRQAKSRPVLDKLEAWLVKNQAEVLPQSLIGKAISYALGQWKYLIRYVDDGCTPIDNNLIERDIRPFAIGRKNWLFSDTVAGTRASAIIYSIMLTCRACNVEPYRYLCHVLTELPRRSIGDDISDLLPFHFEATGMRLAN